MKEGPFIDRKQYRDYLSLNFPNEDDLSKQDYIAKYDRYAFIIVDPFNWTYNHGKPATLTSPLNSEYL